MIPFLVFGEYDQVVSALVFFPVFIVQTFTGDIHFTTDNGLERLFRFCFFELGLQLRQLVLLVGVIVGYGGNFLLDFLYGAFQFTVFLFDVVVKFLHTEHISVVGQGDSRHTIIVRFVYQRLYACLPVENRILRVNMQMYKWLHNDFRDMIYEVKIRKRGIIKPIIPYKNRLSCLLYISIIWFRD